MNQTDILVRSELPSPITCPNCENTYTLTHIQTGSDWNDFGYRYCPYCGDMSDLHISYTNSKPRPKPRENPLL